MRRSRYTPLKGSVATRDWDDDLCGSFYRYDLPQRSGALHHRRRSLRTKWVSATGLGKQRQASADEEGSLDLHVSAEDDRNQKIESTSNSSTTTKAREVSVPPEDQDSLVIHRDRAWHPRFQRLMNSGETLKLFRVPEKTMRLAIENTVSRDDALLDCSGDALEDRRHWKAYRQYCGGLHDELWQDIMLFSMQSSPIQALKFLVITIEGHETVQSTGVLSDCLTYLADCFFNSDQEPDPSIVSDIIRLTEQHLLSQEPADPRMVIFDDHLAFLLFKHAETRFYEALSRAGSKIHGNTLLHFVYKASDWGMLSVSLQMLRSLQASDIDPTLPRVRSVCTQLLKQQETKDDRYAAQMAVLTELLRLGFHPDIQMLDRCLLNSIQAKDLKMALQLYEVASGNGLEPDHATYKLLLKAARLTTDPTLIGAILKIVEADQRALREDSWLLSEYFNTSYYQKCLLRESALPRMMELYQTYCRLEPLVKLGIYSDAPDTCLDIVDRETQTPGPYILGTILRCYIIGHSNRNPGTVLELYQRFRDLVDLKDPDILPLTRFDLVANSFIISLRRSYLPQCVDVVRHMLGDVVAAGQESGDSLPKSGSNSGEVASGSSMEVFPVSAPTVRTWSLLIQAHLLQGQRAGAERILSLMQQENKLPNAHTWNIVVDGYAKMQDIKGTLSAVRRMQQAGHNISTATMQSFGWIRDQETLIHELNRTSPASVDEEAIDVQPEPLSTNVESKLHVPDESSSSSPPDLDEDMDDVPLDDLVEIEADFGEFEELDPTLALDECAVAGTLSKEA